MEPCVKAGDVVLLPEYGGTKLSLDNEVSVICIKFASDLAS